MKRALSQRPFALSNTTSTGRLAVKRWIVIVVGAGLALVGAAYATIPSSGVIDACYTKSGTLRVIDPAVSTCGKYETPLAWNVQGPRGEAGPQGPQGPTGETGPQGPQGQSGVTGHATVMSSGLVRPERSQGIEQADVVKPAGTAGVYCFLDTIPDFDVVLSQPLSGHVGEILRTVDVQILGSPIASACPEGTRLVVAAQTGLGTPIDRSFYLVLH